MRRKQNHNNGGNKSGQRRRFRPHTNNAAKAKNLSNNRDKYLGLAQESLASGDRIEAENYFQHADHYQRVLTQLQAEDAQIKAERQQEHDDVDGGENASEDQGAAKNDSAPKDAAPEEAKPEQDAKPQRRRRLQNKTTKAIDTADEPAQAVLIQTVS